MDCFWTRARADFDTRDVPQEELDDEIIAGCTVADRGHTGAAQPGPNADAEVTLVEEREGAYDAFRALMVENYAAKAANNELEWLR